MNRTLGILVVLFVLIIMAVAVQGPYAAEQSNQDSPSIAGTWRWTFKMPDGTVTRPKLVLKLEDGRLGGTTSFRPGTHAPITNVVLKGDELRFQVIRQRDNEKIVTTYTGKWSEDNISGRIDSSWAGDTQTFDWDAQRANSGVEGVWRWTNSFFGGFRGGGVRGARRGAGSESRVELKQDGEKVTGKTISRSGPPAPITNGSITNGILYFEIERTFGQSRFVTRFQGRQTGDTINGTMELESDAFDTREIEWEAKRVD